MRVPPCACIGLPPWRPLGQNCHPCPETMTPCPGTSATHLLGPNCHPSIESVHLAHPFRSTLPPNFPLTPSSHRCEGVSGKFGGASTAACRMGWAKRKWRNNADDTCSKAPSFRPGKRPGSTPDPRACSRAYFRANWRAISRSRSRSPQSIAGADSVWSECCIRVGKQLVTELRSPPPSRSVLTARAENGAQFSEGVREAGTSLGCVLGQERPT